MGQGTGFYEAIIVRNGFIVPEQELSLRGAW